MSAGGGGGHVFPLLRPPPHIFLPTFIQNNQHHPIFSENCPFFLPSPPLIHPQPITLQLEKESAVASLNETFTEDTSNDFSTAIEQLPSVEQKDSSFVSAEKGSTQEELDHEFTTDSVLKSFKLGLSHQPLAGFRPTEQSLYAYNNLMKHFSLRGNLDEVLRLFFEMKEFKLNPNVLCYNTVINALAKSGHHKDAQKLFDEMLLLGVTPNLSTFNIFIKLHSIYSKQFNLAYKCIERMKQFGFEPDSTTYSTLITGLSKADKIEEAWGVLDSMLAQKCNPTVYTFTPIIQGYCIQGKIDKAKDLMSTMEKSGFPPNTITYNILINALCKIGRFDEVEKVLEHSQFKGWVPNSITYNTYMNGLCKFGMSKQALEKLEIMIHKELNPTNITLGILIDCLCRDSRFLEAQSLLERSLSMNNGIGIVGYNTLMSRLCEKGKWMLYLNSCPIWLKRV